MARQRKLNRQSEGQKAGCLQTTVTTAWTELQADDFNSFDGSTLVAGDDFVTLNISNTSANSLFVVCQASGGATGTVTVTNAGGGPVAAETVTLDGVALTARTVNGSFTVGGATTANETLTIDGVTLTATAITGQIGVQNFAGGPTVGETITIGGAVLTAKAITGTITVDNVGGGPVALETITIDGVVFTADAAPDPSLQQFLASAVIADVCTSIAATINDAASQALFLAASGNIISAVSVSPVVTVTQTGGTFGVSFVEAATDIAVSGGGALTGPLAINQEFLASSNTADVVTTLVDTINNVNTQILIAQTVNAVGWAGSLVTLTQTTGAAPVVLLEAATDITVSGAGTLTGPDASFRQWLPGGVVADTVASIVATINHANTQALFASGYTITATDASPVISLVQTGAGSYNDPVAIAESTINVTKSGATLDAPDPASQEFWAGSVVADVAASLAAAVNDPATQALLSPVVAATSALGVVTLTQAVLPAVTLVEAATDVAVSGAGTLTDNILTTEAHKLRTGESFTYELYGLGDGAGISTISLQGSAAGTTCTLYASFIRG